MTEMEIHSREKGMKGIIGEAEMVTCKVGQESLVAGVLVAIVAAGRAAYW